MKKVVVSVLALVVACPAFAGPKQPQKSFWNMWGLDPYIGMRIGASYNALNYNFNDHKETMSDELFQGRVALGLEMCDTVRSEIEWSMYTKAKDTKDFGSVGEVKVENELQTLLFNTYMEFGHYKIVRPFVGLGAGVAFTDLTREVPSLDERYTESKTRFSAMGTLGVTFDMQHYAVDIAARYNYIDVASGLHNFGGDVGIRFMF